MVKKGRRCREAAYNQYFWCYEHLKHFCPDIADEVEDHELRVTHTDMSPAEWKAYKAEQAAALEGRMTTSKPPPPVVEVSVAEIEEMLRVMSPGTSLEEMLRVMYPGITRTDLNQLVALQFSVST